MDRPTLYTFAPSHFSEKGRWALDYAGIDYREVRLLPGFHRFSLRRVGAGKSVPALKTASKVLIDSPSILAFASDHLPTELSLYPQPWTQEIQTFEAWLGKALGRKVPVFAYHYLLPHRRLILPLLTEGCRGWQARIFPFLFPLISRGMRKGLRIHQSSADAALCSIREALDEVARKISDGREYLFGSSFTAADLSLAALTAPLFQEPLYGGTRIPSEGLPEPLPDLLADLKHHPVASFTSQIYQRHRQTGKSL